MNGIMLQGFEWELPADGTHWKKLASMAAGLARLGVTAVWLPPATKGSGGKNDVGYGVYDLFDLGEFKQKGTVRTKYGTKAEYRTAVRALQAVGIQCLADAVLNHRLGADEKESVPVRPADPGDRRVIAPEAEPGEVYTKFTFPGRHGVYSRFVWDHTRFTGVDYNALDPQHRLFLLDGKSWAPDVDAEHGNFDYLMGADVDVCDPQVEAELVHWGLWYLDATGVDGFRLDAVKHISAGFYRRWLQKLRGITRREIYAVGEYWNADVGTLLRYLDQVGGGMDLFDVPLHYHLFEASRSGGSYDMRGLMAGTLTSVRTQEAVTFVDNHDTQPGQSLESWVDGWFKASAYGLILLRADGYPCVFWGDLYGIPARGIGAVADLKRLLRIRRWYAYGEERSWFDDPHIVGFTRAGSRETPGSGLAFLCTNAAGGAKRMEVGTAFAGQVFRCAIGGQPDVTIGADGWAEFRVPDGGCSVYTPKLTFGVFLRHAVQDAVIGLRAWLNGRKKG